MLFKKIRFIVFFLPVILLSSCSDSLTDGFSVKSLDENGVILFESEYYKTGSIRIHQINPDGTDIKVLEGKANGNPMGRTESLSPDGSMHAYINSYRDTLFLNDIKKETTHTITGFEFTYHKSWSNDASQIAFTAIRERENGDQHGIFVANADGTDIRFVTETTYFYMDLGSWSPDHKRIAYSEETENSESYDIYAIGIDGNGLTQLTNNSIDEGNPLFSPDGSKILYEYNDGSGPIADYIMNIDGTGKKEITNDQGIVVIDPRWSPSGKKIVFWGIPEDTDGREIYTANPDGSDPTSLTPGAFNNSRPIWVPKLKY